MHGYISLASRDDKIDLHREKWAERCTFVPFKSEMADLRVGHSIFLKNTKILKIFSKLGRKIQCSGLKRFDGLKTSTQPAKKKQFCHIDLLASSNVLAFGPLLVVPVMIFLVELLDLFTTTRI